MFGASWSKMIDRVTWPAVLYAVPDAPGLPVPDRYANEYGGQAFHQMPISAPPIPSYFRPMSPGAERKFNAVLFDLLTALLDSWSLWNIVAASPEHGRKWRAAYLRRTYETGAYRPYEALVAEAAAEVGLSPALAAHLAVRYGELEPWPEVREVLGALRREGVALGVVTNCSEKLAAKAVACTGTVFDVVMTAERAGFYKPDSRPYEMALDELGAMPGRCLFVAGSAYDLFGASKVGLPAYWHDRIGMAPPPGAPEPIAHHRSLYPLLAIICST